VVTSFQGVIPLAYVDPIRIVVWNSRWNSPCHCLVVSTSIFLRGFLVVRRKTSQSLVVSNNPPESPYAPGFGFTPPYLAGRDAVLAQIKRALDQGPRSPWYIHGISGDRGVGKTSLLNAIEVHAAKAGWSVVSLQVVPGEPQIHTLARDLVSAATSTWGKAAAFLKDIDIELTVGVDLKVAKAEAKLSGKPGVGKPPSIVLRDILIAVGSYAKDQGGGVLITIDEAHEWNTAGEIAALASALQLVVKRKNFPIAVYFAGLLNLSTVFEGAGTFLERMGIEELHVLTPESTRLALIEPATEKGIRFDREAVDLLIAGCEGYPYLVQLAGNFSWQEMNGSVIDLAAATKGLAKARIEVEKLYSDRWEKLTVLERAYVHSVARLGEDPTTSDVAKSLKRTQQQLGTTRDALINEHRLLRATQRGHISLALPGFGSWVTAQPRVRTSAPARVKKAK